MKGHTSCFPFHLYGAINQYYLTDAKQCTGISIDVRIQCSVLCELQQVNTKE